MSARRNNTSHAQHGQNSQLTEQQLKNWIAFYTHFAIPHAERVLEETKAELAEYKRQLAELQAVRDDS